jgi:hypothetical protein
MKGS